MRALVLSLWAAGGAPPVTLNPDAGQLPGSNVLSQLTNGIGGWALIAAIVGIVVGAIIWAFGRRTTSMKSLVIRHGCLSRAIDVARRMLWR